MTRLMQSRVTHRIDRIEPSTLATRPEILKPFRAQTLRLDIPKLKMDLDCRGKIGIEIIIAPAPTGARPRSSPSSRPASGTARGGDLLASPLDKVVASLQLLLPLPDSLRAVALQPAFSDILRGLGAAGLRVSVSTPVT